jgi:N-acetylmuramoyl-L-alanine amidase
LNERVSIANLSNADLLVSIHHDSVQEKYLSYYEVDGEKKHFCDKFSGYSIFYSKLNKKLNESFIFTKLLADELLNKGFIPTLHHAEKIEGENREIVDTKRGIYQFEDLIVLKKTEIPAILLETGIIVNRLEEQKLNKKSYRKKIIDSIVEALIKYNYVNTSKKDSD